LGCKKYVLADILINTKTQIRRWIYASICVASQKGGSGKSTISAHLSVEAGKQLSVAIIDTDNPQGSLSQWWNVRKAETPIFIREYAPDLAIDLTIIDPPPRIDPVLRKSILVADLLIIPIRPSPNDLRAVPVIIQEAEKAKKPFIFVVNSATPRATITHDAVRMLAQYGKVAPVTLHSRVDFATAMIDGRTAQELKATSKSAAEVAELWSYVQTQLDK
jgi:chromosome partitioning protein